MAGKQDLRHVVSDAPRVMVVDGSKLVRKLVGDTLLKELPGAQVIGCSGIAEARKALEDGAVDLVTTALVLPDGDGLALARSVREASGQAYVPVIVISGNAQEALETRAFTEDITDYFDKSLGQGALAAFIRGYVHPAPIEGARYSLGHLGYTYNKPYWNDANFGAIDQMKKIAAGAGVSMPRFALAWVLSNPAITAMVNGATSTAQLEENVAATEVKLSRDILAACDDVWRTLRAPTVFYGR